MYRYKVECGCIKEKGLSKIAGKKSLGYFSSALINTNLPPQEAAKHPGFGLLISILTEKKAVGNFWQTFSSSMTSANNKGLLGWMFLRELSRTSLDLVPGLLTKHTLTVGSQLAVKKTSVGVVKEVFTKLSESKDDSINKLTIIKNLLDVDMCWDKLPLSGNVFNLASTSSPEVIKSTAEIFVKTIEIFIVGIVAVIVTIYRSGLCSRVPSTLPWLLPSSLLPLT